MRTPALIFLGLAGLSLNTAAALSEPGNCVEHTKVISLIDETTGISSIELSGGNKITLQTQPPGSPLSFFCGNNTYPDVPRSWKVQPTKSPDPAPAAPALREKSSMLEIMYSLMGRPSPNEHGADIHIHRAEEFPVKTEVTLVSPNSKTADIEIKDLSRPQNGILSIRCSEDGFKLIGRNAKGDTELFSSQHSSPKATSTAACKTSYSLNRQNGKITVEDNARAVPQTGKANTSGGQH